MQTVEVLTKVLVQELGYLNIFRNSSAAFHSKDIYSILRRTEQCLFPSPQSAVYFTNLYPAWFYKYSRFSKSTRKIEIPFQRIQ